MGKGDLRAAHRYARALFLTALGHNELEAVAQNLDEITQAENDVPELMKVLHHPLLSRDRKKEILKKVFAGRVRPDVENFLQMLIDKDRVDIIPEMARQYRRFLDEHRREIDAQAVSAVALTDQQIIALRARIEATTGYSVRLETAVDPALLGGLRVRVGDKLFDGSIATRLQRMEELLHQVKVS